MACGYRPISGRKRRGAPAKRPGHRSSSMDLIGVTSDRDCRITANDDWHWTVRRDFIRPGPWSRIVLTSGLLGLEKAVAVAIYPVRPCAWYRIPRERHDAIYNFCIACEVRRLRDRDRAAIDQCSVRP